MYLYGFVGFDSCFVWILLKSIQVTFENIQRTLYVYGFVEFYSCFIWILLKSIQVTYENIQRTLYVYMDRCSL
jgi:hypothetical protein